MNIYSRGNYVTREASARGLILPPIISCSPSAYGLTVGEIVVIKTRRFRT